MTRAGGAAGSARRLGVGSAFVDGELIAGDVEVRDGLVSAVGLTPSGSGIAIAGLVDIQVNGYGGVDVGSTDAEGVHRAGRALASDGVLAWCPTVITGTDDAMVDGDGRRGGGGCLATGRRGADPGRPRGGPVPVAGPGRRPSA